MLPRNARRTRPTSAAVASADAPTMWGKNSFVSMWVVYDSRRSSGRWPHDAIHAIAAAGSMSRIPAAIADAAASVSVHCRAMSATGSPGATPVACSTARHAVRSGTLTGVMPRVTNGSWTETSPESSRMWALTVLVLRHLDAQVDRISAT